jgi:sugar O-acyltransferase (sialic acid O-acetyltransferase NeuD family)
MMRILIIGAGGHAQVIADVILCRTRLGEDVRLVGFVDDNTRLLGSEMFGVKVLGRIEQVAEFDPDAVIVGIGDNATRARVYDQLKASGVTFGAIIHPRAVVAENVRLGEGSVVFANAVINTGSIIGPNVIVNTGATVDHHAHIGAHVHIAPGVHLGGTVTVEEGTFLGIGSSVIPNRTLGAWSTVGAGAVIIHDVPPHATVVGIPAKPLQR